MKEVVEVVDAINELELLIHKFNQREYLDLYELDNLYLFFKIEKEESLLSDPRFKYAHFRQLYIIYGQDLKFNLIFYKPNPNKKINEIIDYKKLQELNNKEYNHEIAVKIRECLIQNQYYIPIDPIEVEKNKSYFKEIAKEWASECLDEKHSDEELKIIAKETRDTLKKKDIEGYLENHLNQIKTTDIFKGLLKTYFIFNEVKKIHRKIEKNNESKSFILNGIKIEITFYSLVHIYNRHFSEILSSDNLIKTKSFHNSKIEPNRINLFIEKLFNLISQSGNEKRIEIKKGGSLLVLYKGTNYALFFNDDKYDKSKIILETFFVIEPDNTNAKQLIDKIKSSDRIKLNEELSIYLNPSQCS